VNIQKIDKRAYNIHWFICADSLCALR